MLQEGANSPSPNPADRSACPCARIGGDLGHRLGMLVAARASAAHAHLGAAARWPPSTWVSGSITSPRRVADEMLEILAAADIEDAAAIAVAVDVEHRLLLQLGGMGLGPFGRAQQHRLLAVPAGVDDGALGLPAGLAPARPAPWLRPASRPGRTADRWRRTPSRRDDCRAPPTGRDSPSPSAWRSRHRWSSGSSRT